MLQDIQEALRVREEHVVFCGKKIVVRESSIDQDLGVVGEGDSAEKRAADFKRKLESELVYYLAVACVFFDDGEEKAGEAVFSVDDLPVLKAGSRTKLSALLHTVRVVNGLSADDDAKK